MPATYRHHGHQELQPPHLVLSAAYRHCSIALAPTPGSAKAARDFTTATMRGWHLDGLIEDAVIVASELAANAIRHGTPSAMDRVEDARIELTWWCQASRLICLVTDRSIKPPVLAPADLDAESGHGLQIVDALAIAWGWTVLGAREKAVWATLRLPGTRRYPDGEPLLKPPGTNNQPQHLPRRRRAGPSRPEGWSERSISGPRARTCYSSNRARHASCRASR
jgi:hypothetical protein